MSEDKVLSHAKTLSDVMIDHAARGQTGGDNDDRSFAYLNKQRQEEMLRRAIRTVDQRQATSQSLNYLYDTDWSSLDTDPADLAQGEVSSAPGTLVELRRSGRVTHAVVVGTIEDEHGLRTHSLTSQGILLPHGEHDIMFSVPSYVDESVAMRCGAFSEPDSSELAARVTVLQKIQVITRATEAVSQSVHTRAPNLYEMFRSPDPEQWTQLTTSTAARVVDHSPSTPLPVLFAMHNFLMTDSTHFVAHPTSHRFTHTFLVRPKAKVELIERVTGWTRNTSNGIAKKFIDKALKVMAENRKLEDEYHDAHPSVVQPKNTGEFVFDDNDRAIICFLCDALQATRSIQDSPYIIPSTYIIKHLGEDPGPAGNSASLQRVLTYMGIFTPWEDMPTLASRISTLANQFQGDRQTIPCALKQKPLGQEDFYSKDLLESVRHDFGDMPVYVIDEPTAEELDDGLSIEPIASEPGRVWVHIHVADPTRLLPPTHTFAVQARRTSESLYFNHGAQPMLPPDSILSTCSLGHASAAGKAEYVMTFSAKIDTAGDIIDYKIRAGVIRNVKTVTYDEVDRLLNTHTITVTYPFLPNPPPPRTRDVSIIDSSDVDNFRSLLQVADRLVDNRARLPIFSFSVPCAEVSFASAQLPPSPAIETTDRFHLFRGFPAMTYRVLKGEVSLSGARVMVGELMKVASRIASRFGVDRGIPLVRRVSAQPIILNPAEFQKLLASRDSTGSVDPLAALRSRIVIPRIVNTIQPKGHWMMGILDGEGYVRATSPLRRYGDLVAHWQIKNALLSPADRPSTPMFSEEWMIDFANEMTIRGREIKRLNIQHNSYWSALYLKRWQQGRLAIDFDPGRTLIARIGSRPIMNSVASKWSTKVLLPELGAWATLEGKKEQEIGSECRVRIADIDISVRPVISVVSA